MMIVASNTRIQTLSAGCFVDNFVLSIFFKPRNKIMSTESMNERRDFLKQSAATLALFAFHEHVALCKRIYGEVNG